MTVPQSLLDAVPDAVLIVDSDGVVQRANRNVPNVLGYSPSDIEGMEVENLFRNAIKYAGENVSISVGRVNGT